MGRVILALRAFFKTLGSGETARRVAAALAPAGGPALPAPAPPPASPVPARPAAARRSDAIALLAVLQREARFVDFLQESLAEYSDEQIGAAAREVHRGCSETVSRMFGIRPLATQSEGQSVDVPAGFNATRYRLTGNVHGSAPYRGTVRHAGWQATRCELPAWTGSVEMALWLAPIEVEL